MGHIYTVDFIKEENEAMKLAGKWMDLESVISMG